MLPLLLTKYKNKELPISKIVELTSANPARIFNIKRRGKIEQNYYADLTIIDIEKSWVIKPEKFNTKAKYSPFKDMRVNGEIFSTMVNGKIVYMDNIFYNYPGREIEFE